MIAETILVLQRQDSTSVAVKPATLHPEPAAGPNEPAAVLPRRTARANVNEVQ
jgi:hypothetical protein